MNTAYRHWTTEVAAFLFMGFLGLYVVTYYLPQMLWSGASFPLMTHVMVPALLIASVTYFLFSARWGHHALMLAVVILLGISVAATDSKAIVAYGLLLALLTATAVHANRRHGSFARPRISLP